MIKLDGKEVLVLKCDGARNPRSQTTELHSWYEPWTQSGYLSLQLCLKKTGLIRLFIISDFFANVIGMCVHQELVYF